MSSPEAAPVDDSSATHTENEDFASKATQLSTKRKRDMNTATQTKTEVDNMSNRYTVLIAVFERAYPSQLPKPLEDWKNSVQAAYRDYQCEYTYLQTMTNRLQDLLDTTMDKDTWASCKQMDETVEASHYRFMCAMLEYNRATEALPEPQAS